MDIVNRGPFVLKTGTGTPSSLNTGEPAWDNTSNTLYVGNTTNAPVAVGGVGGLGVPHALLDNSQNRDTKATVVGRGYVIRGNSTPLWEGLAPGAANAVLGYDGADVNWTNTRGTGNVARETYVSAFSGKGSPDPTLGQTNSIYFDVTDPANLRFYYKS